MALWSRGSVRARPRAGELSTGWEAAGSGRGPPSQFPAMTSQKQREQRPGLSKSKAHRREQPARVGAPRLLAACRSTVVWRLLAGMRNVPDRMLGPPQPALQRLSNAAVGRIVED